MYIPPIYEYKNIDKIRIFLKENSFGILVSNRHSFILNGKSWYLVSVNSFLICG